MAKKSAIQKQKDNEKIEARTRSHPFRLCLGVFILGCVGYFLPRSDPDVQDVLVRFTNAGSTAKLKSSHRLNRSFFETLLEDSALYSGTNGKQLLTWPDLIQVSKAAQAQEVDLLVGPYRERASTHHFQWPPVEFGHRVEVVDVPLPSLDSPPIVLETINVDPPIFFVHNFLSDNESDAVVQFAMSKQNPYSMRRSTTGTKSWTQHSEKERKQATVSTRTSENGFVIDTPEAMSVKRRMWRLLRMSGAYDEALMDGMQVLRYKQKQAYISHHDSFQLQASKDHNWDPSRNGTNRFATLVVYLNDVAAGGQTVFPDVQGEKEEVPAIASKLFVPGSWEEVMVKDCHSKMRIKPKKGNAVLFYSQSRGNLVGQLHGACPVLNGTKWAANVWVWNGCRYTQCQERHLKTGIVMPFKL